MPVGADSSDVAARRVQNWVYAWSAFARVDGFTGLQRRARRTALVERLREQTHHIRDNLTAERNHRTLELYALIVVALALPQLDPDGELLRLGMREIHANLLTDVRPDGVHREHSTHYHLIALRSFLARATTCAGSATSCPPSYDAHLVARVRLRDALPPPRRLDPGAVRQRQRRLRGRARARAPTCSTATTCATSRPRRAHGAPPARRMASFRDGGYWTQRSGWGGGADAFATSGS